MTAAQRWVMRAPSRPSRPSRKASVTDAVLDQRPERRHAVVPRDLLALVELAAGVRDRHLVDTHAAFQDLRRDLGLDVEAVGRQRELVEQAAVDELVAG